MTPALVLAPLAAAALALSAATPAVAPAVSARFSAGAPAGEGSVVDAAVAPVRFTWPLRPRPAVLRRFAVGPQPWSPGHRGVDLAGGAGTPVLAAAAGRISFAGPVAGVGVVVVDHGALRTTYEPVTPTVKVGAAVTAGARIGTLTASTAHCGVVCLHWGALRGDVYVDPLLLPGLAGPPVLLPLGGW